MYGKGIADSGFIDRALSTIREFMADDGQFYAYDRFIASASTSVSFAKALNRTVTGSVNDLVKFAKHWLIDDEISPHDLGFRLNDVLLSALATGKSHGYGKPNEAFRTMSGFQTANERIKQ